MTRAELREEIRQTRERLARLEELQKRQDDAEWREFQRERAEAIKQADRRAPVLLT